MQRCLARILLSALLATIPSYGCGRAGRPDQPPTTETPRVVNQPIPQLKSGRILDYDDPLKRLKCECPCGSTESYDRYGGIVFSPDGRWIAAAGGLGNIQLIDTSPARRNCRLTFDQKDCARQPKFFPDSQSLAAIVGPVESGIHVWSLKDLKPQATLHGEFTSFDIAPDGKRIAVSDMKGVRVLDFSGRTMAQTIPRFHTNDSLRFSPDGQFLAWSNHAGSNVWDLTSREPALYGDERYGNTPVFLHEGKTLARLTKDGAVLQDRPSGRVIATVETFPRPSVISPDGKLIVAIDSARGRLNLFEVASNRWIGWLPSEGWALFSPDGRRLAGVEAGHVVVWDIGELADAASPTDSLIHTLPPDTMAFDVTSEIPPARLVLCLEGLRSVAISPDGARLATQTEMKRLGHWQHRKLEIWDSVTGARIATLPDHCEVHAFSPDGSLLACVRNHPSATDPIIIDFLETDDPRQLRGSIDLGSMILYEVDFSADGKQIALMGRWLVQQGDRQIYENRVAVWSVSNGSQQMMTAVEGSGEFLEFSRDGSLLAVPAENTVRLWETGSWEERPALRHTHPVKAFAISPDSQKLLVLEVQTKAYPPDGADRGPPPMTCFVRLWDLRSGKLIETPFRAEGYSNGLPRLSFHPNGRLLAIHTNLYNRWLAQFWKLDEYELIEDVTFPTDTVRRIEFSLDRETMVGVGRSSVRVWNTPETLRKEQR